MNAAPAPSSGGFRQFLRYLAAGGVGAVLDYAFFALATLALGNPYLGRAAALLLSISSMYLLHRRWTFRARNRAALREYAAFGLVQLLAAGVNYLVFGGVLYWLSAQWPEHAWGIRTLAFLSGCAVGLLINYGLLAGKVFHRA